MARSNLRGKLLLFAAAIWGLFLYLAEKKELLSDTPTWVVFTLFLMANVLFIIGILDHPEARGIYRWIYNRSKYMSLAVFIITGAGLGAGSGAIGWWILHTKHVANPTGETTPSQETRTLSFPKTDIAVTDSPEATVKVNSDNQTVSGGNNQFGNGNTQINIQQAKATMQAGLRSILIPANDPMPDTPDFVIEPDRKAMFVGPFITSFPIELKSFSLIQIGGEDVLAVEWNSDLGIVINATIRNENGELIAAITKNVFHSYAPNDYTVTSDDHSILILNSKDEIVLYVRYLNPRAIKAMGIFNHPGHRTVRVEEGRYFIGKSEIAARIYGKAAGDGPWALKAVLVVQ
jgi:hypothetical protein